MRNFTRIPTWSMLPLAVLLLLATMSSPANARTLPPLLVYTNNVENLLSKDETCEGDWAELIYYIAEHGNPDLLLLQQVTDSDQVERFIDKLEDNVSADYRFLIADTEPDGGGRCGAEKGKQLNAIVWNTGSLSYVSGSRDEWQSMRENPGDSSPQCVKNDQSRTVNVKAMFQHVTGLRITAASVHWPTHASGNFLCADNSARDLDAQLKKSPYKDSTLQVVGGDMNYRDTNSQDDWSKWYKEMRSNAFADPVRGLCPPTGSCNDGLWTHITDGVKRRIDYLFARYGTGLPATALGAKNVTFSEANAAELRHHEESDSGCTTYPGRSGCFYSEHRAVVAQIL